MSFGVIAGASRQYQLVASKPGTPASATVGRSGAATYRFGVVTAKARSWPDFTSGSTEMSANEKSRRPPITSASTAPVPL